MTRVGSEDMLSFNRFLLDCDGLDVGCMCRYFLVVGVIGLTKLENAETSITNTRR